LPVTPRVADPDVVFTIQPAPGGLSKEWLVMRNIHSGRVSSTSALGHRRADRWTYAQWSPQPDPFAVNPIRRSAILVVTSALVFFGPLLFGGPNGAMAIIAGGWLGLVGLAIGIPVLLLSLGEAGYQRLIETIRPSVYRLNLSPRLQNILVRHGYSAIDAIEATPDPVLLLLSNMEVRDVREVRRAISLWRYQEWQAKGFP
jgi:hypothetical protein